MSVLIGSLLEHQHSDEPVILRDEAQFSGEGLTDDE